MKKKLVDAALVAQAREILARRSANGLLLNPPAAADRPDKSWYRIAQTADEATVTIYDEIGMWGCSANDFVTEFADINAKVINVRINSPGGSVFDGIAIYNAIAEKQATINVYVDGWAASIASVIMCAGDKIFISEAAQVMIHKPWSFVIGNDDDMIKEAEILASLESAIVDIYVARTGGDRKQIEAWVKAETWFKGKDAVANGFADEVVPLKIVKPAKDAANIQASAPAARLARAFFSSIFSNVPEDVLDALEVCQESGNSAVRSDAAPGTFDFENGTPREYETHLRKQGASRADAKRLASTYRPASELRDEAAAESNRLRDEGDEAKRARETALRDEAISAVTAAIILMAAQSYPK